MLLHPTDWQMRLQAARRVFGLIPIVVFLLGIMVFATPVEHSPVEFAQVVLRAMVMSLASLFVCVGAYGFYRYLIEKSPGL